MTQTTTTEAGSAPLCRSIERILRHFRSPHPTTNSFIKHADRIQGCQRHIMLCARSLSGIGCMPPPAQESTYQSIIEVLEDAMASEPCWPTIRPLLDEHWQEFAVPPGDCIAKARNIIIKHSEPIARYTAGCRPPTDSNYMQAEALEGIQEANEHMIAALAGSFIQYSLTSEDYRPKYESTLVERLSNRIAAINHLDQNCAFTLHTNQHWKGANHTDDVLARLFLWGERVNSANYQIRQNGESRTMALVMARRRLGKTLGQIVQLKDQATPKTRQRTAETAAYWLEVARNLTPVNNHTRTYYGIDEVPNLRPNQQG